MILSVFSPQKRIKKTFNSNYLAKIKQKTKPPKDLSKIFLSVV
jgi:hypothetical protein